MDEQTEQPQAPVEAPAPAPATDDLDALLAEWDRTAGRPPETPPANEQEPLTQDVSSSDLDALLAGLDPSAEKIQGLEAELGQRDSELNQLRHEEFVRQEREAFESFAGELQDRLPGHVPPDYAKNALLAYASQNPAAAAAWDARGVSAEVRAAAPAQLRQLEQLYQKVLAQPDDPRKQSALNFIMQRGQQLEIIIQGPGILNKAVRDIETAARKFKPFDSDSVAATETRMEIAAAMRGASAPIPETPAPNLSQMSTQEYRRYLATLGIHNF